MRTEMLPHIIINASNQKYITSFIGVLVSAAEGAFFPSCNKHSLLTRVVPDIISRDKAAEEHKGALSLSYEGRESLGDKRWGGKDTEDRVTHKKGHERER